MKNMPGPLAPPDLSDQDGILQLAHIPSQPERDDYILSSSCWACSVVTLTQKNKDRGSRAKQRRREAKASRIAQQPGPSGSPRSSRCKTLLVS